ncbi:MAG TPA: LAGLIDADG family homing endonuclease [Candidatus Saccharimonadales bacterium]|nr:LAGLIDADG family homing endonuclease [Candidatus Saccharimonadales bacterium]
MKAIPREVRSDTNPVETTRRRRCWEKDSNILKAYLWGAVHDGTYHYVHRTWRISQANDKWLQRIQDMLVQMGYRSWIYREGKSRSVSVIETTADFLARPISLLEMSVQEQRAYIRGYFDAEGGIPRRADDWMYIQLCQKNRQELENISTVLERLGIHCGKIHNPSQRVDPNYWRLFIARKSHRDFIEIIGSWHPRKQLILKHRLKI